ncbi:hypothetical protein TUBRATIS_004060 [Tubulinosema ratisbonensis]|uniref:Yos1-like protein n=1 Tax=Tubulinosema ratisbonensis TaxID=291195 RepID=A0A437APH0_9MICR|nr:hypothetical protein TUBRATIS_004060 [Tubulinosema ratisbonensis]
MIGSLLSLCSACIFFLNGITILNNQRFLRRIGLPLDPEARKNLSPTKAKLVDLIKLTKGIATIPLIFLNLILIFYESFFGSD